MSHSSHATGKLPVVLALIGNASIGILKFFGWLVSGSGAMLSEAIHSLADTSNQALLLLGIYRSRKKPNIEFAYGFGRERFFWSLISACGIFFLGAGVTVSHGITTLLHPGEFINHWFVWLALIAAFVVELITLTIAVVSLRRQFIGKPISEMFRRGDPTTLAVILEDSVAVLGVIVAGASIGLVRYTSWDGWDAVGSIIIGILLGVVAIVLISQNRRWLLGRALPPGVQEEVIELLVADPAIEKVIDFKSAALDIGRYRIKCEVEFNGSALLKNLYRPYQLKALHQEAMGSYSDFTRFCAKFTDRVPRLVGEHINALEKKIQQRFPSIDHVDIELN